MPDWTQSMQQTFEYYTVDPGTWADVKRLDNVKSCTITRDATTETLGSATIDVTESVGESYIRVYLITIQNGVTEKHPLGTYLAQTPSSSFNGKIRSVTMDAYTPLIELKESQPPIGYSLLKSEGVYIMDKAYELTRENLRAPVIDPMIDEEDAVKLTTNFVSNTNDTWLSYLTDLMAVAKYTYSIDELGRILFSPKQDAASLQPVWTYDDGNSSILLPDINMNHDIFGIPNVVEVVYTEAKQGLSVEVVNDDPNSPISTVNRGRRITKRIVDPNIMGTSGTSPIPTKEQLYEYAEQVLKELSTLEYSVSYTHGYCPVRIGDCVRLNYAGAQLSDIKAKVVSQSIKCEPGCKVSEKAVYTTKLWR